MKNFNVAGNCIPAENYMVDIGEKISQIIKLIDERRYFTINRARQYGKTTTLYLLEQELIQRCNDRYTVASISFQRLSDKHFSSEGDFCAAFIKHVGRALKFTYGDQSYIERWENHDVGDFDLLAEHISELCIGRQVVLMIDEVDKTTSNRVFLQFLSTLRELYIARRNGKDHTFHSVILAGVYDIKNIKLKMIKEGLYVPTETEDKLYNSPWNIAADFEIDMSFKPAEIATMLGEYEADHATGMEIGLISEEIYRHTGGYPFMVSRICQYIDEKLSKNWTADGVQTAVNMLLTEANTLFDDLKKNIEMYPDLKKLLRELLLQGVNVTFNTDNNMIGLGHMFGYLKGENGMTAVANKIFEQRIYNYFISENEVSGEARIKAPPRAEVVEDGHFDMELLLRKFAQHYGEIYRQKDAEFLERHGGLLFLTYLKPFVNGYGYCHIESRVNDFAIDITVDYGSEQFVVELKIWHGAAAHERAYGQLANYLSLKNADTGYLLSFDFRKEQNKERRAQWVEFDGKRIFDVVV